MADTTFRTTVPVSDTKPEVTTHTKEEQHVGSEAAVPHTDYQKFNAKPYTVEYFGLGDRWNDPVGGYPKEISLIESFINEKIESGEYPNDTKAVKSRLQSLERLVGLQKDERLPIKIETMVAYMKFMREKANISRNASIYGTH